jgi:hypothetical protein
LRRLRTVPQGIPIAVQLEWSVADHSTTHVDKIIDLVPQLHPKMLALKIATVE